MKPNVINDVSVLTRIPSKVFEGLTEKINLCIGSVIRDAIDSGETATAINIGIGTLSINVTDMQCKFIPSKELKGIIKSCLDTKIDPLELELEKILADKLLTICSEVI